MAGNGTCVVTGGAGFIGTATLPRIVGHYEQVIVVDNLHPQVHGENALPPAARSGVRFFRGDVSDPSTWRTVVDALEGASPAAVLHLAAETGTGQSLLASTRHASVNVVGTSMMLDHLASADLIPARIVVASSRALYGEGAWRRADGALIYPGQRSTEQLEAAQWDVPNAEPTAMRADVVAPVPVSVYGVTKLAQEQLLRTWCTSLGVDFVALRLQNVYGAGQSLTNPYTGIMQVFARIAREGGSIPLFEDGQVRRDFVHVTDVAEALERAMIKPLLGSTTLDIGSGEFQTIAEAAEIIADQYGAPAPHITGEFRQGDVRHAWADTSVAAAALGWSPRVDMRSGLAELIDWVEDQLA